MKILIDLQGAQNGSRRRGIGRYSLALTRGIARNAGKHSVVILLNGLFADTIPELKSSLAGVVSEDQFLVFTAQGPVAEISAKNFWRRRSAEILREHVISMLSPDVVLVTSMVEGASDNSITSVGTLRSDVATTAILYDLIPMLDANYFTNQTLLEHWYQQKMAFLRRTDFLFAISESAMSDAINHLGIDSENICNISSAVDLSLVAQPSPERLKDVALRLGITRPFILHAGAFDSRKNLQGLVRAYATLSKPMRLEYQLVLVCNLDRAARRELTELTQATGLLDHEVVLTGYVSDEDLFTLYEVCHLFVFPSFQEGFGLPALEAMSRGAATIGSNIPSLLEVIGRSDALFDPTSIQSIAEKISHALMNKDFYRSLKAHAWTQAGKFSWDFTATRALNSIQHLLSRSSAHDKPDMDPAQKRSLMLDAIAKLAIECSATDLELLAVAHSIEANEEVVRRLKYG